MAQQAGTVNFLIRDTNGNPQYFKIQQAGKVVKSTPEGVKIIAHKGGSVSQVLNASNVLHGDQVIRTLQVIQGKPKQIMTIPVQSSITNVIKSERSPAASPKSVALTSPQVIYQPPQVNQRNSMVPLLDHGGNKKRQDFESDLMPEYSSVPKRRKTEKGGKGLRHFSMKVCEKVRKKGTTSYNEVADELVAEFTNPNLVPNSVDQQYDQKNIRRRVYDALNVLMAMNIISKEKKEIKWLGLPTNTAQECVSLVTEKQLISDRIKTKTQHLNELLIQQITYRNLIQRNYEAEKTRGDAPAANTAIHLPFIVVNSDRKTVIDCSITNDKTEYKFIFNDKFEVHDDFEILKKIGLDMGLGSGEVPPEDLPRIKSMLPKVFEKYIIKMAQEGSGVGNGVEGNESALGRTSFANESGTSEAEVAGPSSDGGFPMSQDDESFLEEMSDAESINSADIEVN